MNGDLILLWFDALAAHPTDANVVYAGSHGNSIFRIEKTLLKPFVEEEHETPPIITQIWVDSTPTQPSTTPQPITPTTAEPINWPVIGCLVGGPVIIMTLLIYFLLLRKRST